MQPATTLSISIDPANTAAWTPLLGGGIGIPTPLGISLKKFLCGQLKIPPEYLAQRIQTILVNSRPVDDLDKIPIAAGDIIALSAAMPGLAGATLRRGGHLAPMRAAISQHEAKSIAPVRQSGVVILKLFNMVAREIGPQILSGEIWIKGTDAVYLRRQNVIAGDVDIDTAPDGWIRIRPLTAA